MATDFIAKKLHFKAESNQIFLNYIIIFCHVSRNTSLVLAEQRNISIYNEIMTMTKKNEINSNLLMILGISNAILVKEINFF